MAKYDKYLNEYSDEELMNLVEQRNTLAFKILYERHNSGLYNFIRRYTSSRELAEDLLQETFTRVWFSAHQFNSKRGTFKAWLFTSGLNSTRNEMVKKRYDYQYTDAVEVTEEVRNGFGNTGGEAATVLENAELKDAVDKAISRLNPFLREVLLLKHYHGLKFREISEITDTPEGTLKARFHNAVAQLRNNLKLEE